MKNELNAIILALTLGACATTASEPFGVGMTRCRKA